MKSDSRQKSKFQYFGDIFVTPSGYIGFLFRTEPDHFGPSRRSLKRMRKGVNKVLAQPKNGSVKTFTDLDDVIQDMP